MKKMALIVFLVSFSLGSCINTCGECFTPPQSFSFNLVDAVSGQNLFANGTYDPEKIQVTNLLNGDAPFEFTFNSENNLHLIQIPRIGWKTETLQLQVAISGKRIFDLFVEAERKTRKCCSHTEYHQIAIDPTEFEQDEKTGVYNIFVE